MKMAERMSADLGNGTAKAALQSRYRRRFALRANAVDSDESGVAIVSPLHELLCPRASSLGPDKHRRCAAFASDTPLRRSRAVSACCVAAGSYKRAVLSETCEVSQSHAQHRPMQHATHSSDAIASGPPTQCAARARFGGAAQACPKGYYSSSTGFSANATCIECVCCLAT